MRTPRNLNGIDFVAALVRNWDYVRVNQTGSHIMIETNTPFHQRLSIPAHKPLKTGTLNALVRLAASHKRMTKQAILDTLELQ